MREMRCGEGTYIANWFAERWQIETEMKGEDEKRPKVDVPPDELTKMKGGETDPIGYFLDDPETQDKYLRGMLSNPEE